ncbi:unnamed protein product [Ceratitis capitata]|uniref:(Mediterranean fruit fly) hypothetical protein n=1 Tax=Ceratitis capitata TaxID=7213 RepID=A0A811UNF1_CERCA|nr:unnamed protein product [Ceratitis capitata]CAD7000619.1 unnamed protein product [Ceratitis capitata]
MYLLLSENYEMVRVNHGNTPKDQHRCPVCKNNHRLLFCRQMRRMEPTERLRAVLLYRHCANCLSPHHMASRCPSTRTCDRCHERHHSLLHLREMEEDVPSSQGAADGQHRRQHCPYRAQPLTESSDEEVLEIDASSEDLVEITEPAHSHNDPTTLRPPLSSVRSVIQRPIQPSNKQRQRQQRSRNKQPRRRQRVRDARERIKTPVRRINGTVLTPTVMVRVATNGRTQRVRALIDPGQPASCISKALARRLQVSSRDPSDRVTLTLKGWRERVHIRARVLPSLIKTTPEHTLDARVVDEFDNLRLADPSFYRRSTVSFILGADIYAAILRPGLMPATPTRPAAQNTLFGWVISGSTPY